jgi:hypothetical protein
MPPPFNAYSIFDDRGEVKQLVSFLVQELDPEVSIEHMRKMDFAYIFILSRGTQSQEVELNREEIDASWRWRSGSVDDTLRRKIENAITGL